MSMDLIPINPGPNAPVDEIGLPIICSYNVFQWRSLRCWLFRHGVNISEFAEYSDEGAIISELTCRRVAMTFEENLLEFENFQHPLILGKALKDPR